MRKRDQLVQPKDRIHLLDNLFQGFHDDLENERSGMNIDQLFAAGVLLINLLELVWIVLWHGKIEIIVIIAFKLLLDMMEFI